MRRRVPVLPPRVESVLMMQCSLGFGVHRVGLFGMECQGPMLLFIKGKREGVQCGALGMLAASPRITTVLHALRGGV